MAVSSFFRPAGRGKGRVDKVGVRLLAISDNSNRQNGIQNQAQQEQKEIQNT
jgi:hypothetical protein